MPDDAPGDVLRPSHGTTKPAVVLNRKIKTYSLKNNGNIQRKECGPKSTVTTNLSSFLIVNEVAKKAMETALLRREFQQGSRFKDGYKY